MHFQKKFNDIKFEILSYQAYFFQYQGRLRKTHLSGTPYTQMIKLTRRKYQK